MKCQRSGYCCTHYDVIIVNDPELGITEDNVIHKPSGVRCQHLKGPEPGKFECAIHSYEWYDQTPCFEYTQVGAPNSPCRTGNYIVNGDGRKLMEI